MEMVGGFGTRWEIKSEPRRFGDGLVDLELSRSDHRLGRPQKLSYQNVVGGGDVRALWDFRRGFEYFPKPLVSDFEIQNLQEKAQIIRCTATHSYFLSMFTSVELAPSGHLFLFIVTYGLSKHSSHYMHLKPEQIVNPNLLSQCIFS